MPSPAKCAAKFKVGSKEYKDCIAYKGAYANKGGVNPANKGGASPVKGRLKRPVGGGGY